MFGSHVGYIEKVCLQPQDAISWLSSEAQAMFITEKDQPAWQGRRGQLWFNLLDPTEQHKLRDTFYDPFYRDSWQDILLALAFLIDN